MAEGSEGPPYPLWCWACERSCESQSVDACARCGSGAVETAARQGLAPASFTPPRLSGLGSAYAAALVQAAGAAFPGDGVEGEREEGEVDEGEEGAGEGAPEEGEGAGGGEGGADDFGSSIRRMIIRRLLLSMLAPNRPPGFGGGGGGGGEGGGGGGGAYGEPLAAFLAGGSLTFGDYAVGDISSIISRLGEQGPTHRVGPPPAAVRVVASLPHARPEELEAGAECSVCQEVFEEGGGEGAPILRLPECRHAFHGPCLTPWLAAHNVCPVCRGELPTDEADYNALHGLDLEGWPSSSRAGKGAPPQG